MVDKELKLDFRLVIGFRELSQKPFSLVHSKLSTQIESGMKALCRSFTDGPRHLIDYQGVLFPAVFSSNKTENGRIIQSISIWSPVLEVSMGSWSYSDKLGTNWIDKKFPKSKLQEIELLLSNYAKNLEVPCTICKNVTPINYITKYPFAGGACPDCLENKRVPNVQTN